MRLNTIAILCLCAPLLAHAQQKPILDSRLAPVAPPPAASAEYKALQHHLQQGWNTWDVQSVATQVLLPDGLAIHFGLQMNATEFSGAFLTNALIGRRDKDTERVVPGAHSWNGSYTDLTLTWRGLALRLQSAHDGNDLVILATPLPGERARTLPPTLSFAVNYLWNRPGTVERLADRIIAKNAAHTVTVYCVSAAKDCAADLNKVMPIPGPYFAMDFRAPAGISTGHRRTIAEIRSILDREHKKYDASIAAAGKQSAFFDAVETTIGWDTNFDAEEERVVSPVSRGWSVGWGGNVLFDWDTFFAATLASVGDKELAYANALEILRSETPAGFVPNFARSGGWKSFDRSEPPVGAITVLGIYQKYHEQWFLRDAFAPLLSWNRWWHEHRDMQGYLTWGSDGENIPANYDDGASGHRDGAVLESGLDNSPMYDNVTYDEKSHQLEFADVGLMGMYIADCDALEKIATELGKTAEARELHQRSAQYRARLATLWDEKSGIFLNKDLHTGNFSHRLSPTNFYPLMANAATQQQADRMLKEHLLNPNEFWGQWIIPSIARNDPAYKDQQYWRGRIWGPMNYLVYLGLRNYADPSLLNEFAQKSDALFQQEWQANRHVHENYNANTGLADDVDSSDRFYHWGALLEYIQYMQQTNPPQAAH